jgi:hypothetical protein
VKVTMQTIMAGPDGVAKPGTVLDVPQQFGDQLLAGHYARPFDKDRDSKAPRGLAKPKEVAE